MPPISLSRVDLPEPLGPISPTVDPLSISRSMSRSAQKSSLCWFDRPKLTSRSLSDFSLRMTNRLQAPATLTTVRRPASHHSSCAKLPCSRAKTRWQTRARQPDQQGDDQPQAEVGGLRQARRRPPRCPRWKAEDGERHRVGQVQRVEERRLHGLVDEAPGVDDRARARSRPSARSRPGTGRRAGRR